MDGGATESPEAGGWWTTTVLWTTVLFGSFLLNATLLFAFLKRSGLRTISNRFVMNLIASNLTTSLFLTPLLTLDAPPSPGGSSLCVISEGASALATASSILSVLLIAIDQYLAVVDPLRYRTRIDKLKCGILIISIWLASVLVALLAAFNPQPRSVWLSCRGDRLVPARENGFDGRGEGSVNATLALTVDSAVLFGNGTEDHNAEGRPTATESNGSSSMEENVGFAENSSAFFGATAALGEGSHDGGFAGTTTGANSRGRRPFRVTYGLAYAAFYTFFVYLLPFVGVCWIYVSIYLAAHKNSERARRTGSGPMLSLPSFCEEYGGASAVRPELSIEDFRRIPKISSLSSIDESIETSPGQIPRRRSEAVLSSSPIEEEPSTGVVFTVGSQKVDVTPRRPRRPAAPAKDGSKVAASALRAEFLGRRDAEADIADDAVRSGFRDRPDDRRKSSHDVLFEAAALKSLEKFRIRYDSSDESSADEDGMLAFAENRRLGDIQVAKCQNSTEDASADSNRAPLIGKRSDRPSPSSADRANGLGAVESDGRREEDDRSVARVGPGHDARPQSLRPIVDRIRTNNKATGGGGTLSRAALENHNAGSKLQNGCRSSRHLRTAAGYDRPESAEDAFRKDHAEAESSLPQGAPMVTITPPNKIPLHRVSSIKSTSSYINSLKYRISNGSLFRYREEARAARISALVIVMGLICWTPYVVATLARNLPIDPTAGGDGDIPHSYDVAAVGLLVLATYVSPLLFAYRSRRVKRELRKIFCFKKELSYKNNRSLMAKKVLKRRHSSNLGHMETESKYNIFSCVYGRSRWPKEKVQFMQVPETALAVETCRSSFSSGASTQISTTSTEE